MPIDTPLTPSDTQIRLYIALNPVEASKYLITRRNDSNLRIDELETLWDQVQKKWGFSVIQEIMIDQPRNVQLRIVDVVERSPAHRAGLIDGDILYQLYECCINPPLKLLFGIMCDSVAIDMTVIRQNSIPIHTNITDESNTPPPSDKIGNDEDPMDRNNVPITASVDDDDRNNNIDSQDIISMEAAVIDLTLPSDDGEMDSSRNQVPDTARLVVNAAPAPILRQSTVDYGTIITSRSKITGLKSKDSSKLRRLYPDTSLFIKRILKYHPPQVVVKENKVLFYGAATHKPSLTDSSEELPISFENASDMRKRFSPILLAEGISSLQQEFLSNSDTSGFWSREVFRFQLVSCIPVDSVQTKTTTSTLRTYEMTLQMNSNNIIPPQVSSGELFCLYCHRWTESRHVILGLAGAGYSNHTFLSDQKYFDEEKQNKIRLWICVSDKQYEETGWLADFEIRNADGSFAALEILVINIGTVADILRQYEGITSIAHVRQEIRDVVYCRPRTPEVSTCDFQAKKPISLPSDVWESLLLNLNPYQASAISKIMSGNTKGSCFLLQGPPGTGKTATIVGLVSALLNGTFPSAATKTSGTKVQVGSTFSKASSSPLEVSVSSRILLCAPSNQSVDDLAWKVKRLSLGPNGKRGDFNLVRVGILPGEDRHDGRGKKKKGNKGVIFSSDDRVALLRSLNLDSIVNEIASGRQVQEYSARSEIEDNKNSSTIRKRGAISISTERRKILSRSHVVCCTLSGTGSRTFIESCAREDFPDQEFDAVIIDESCQASEAICLIPFKYNPNVIILVGDPQQLPVTILSQDAKRLLADRSLFERLQQNYFPTHLLKIQYRMHQEIAAFPSLAFYNSQLLPSDALKDRKNPSWYQHYAFPPYLIWNTGDNNSDVIGKGGSYSNKTEIQFILDLLREFAKHYNYIRNLRIGIITFYGDQAEKINESMSGDNIINTWLRSSQIDLQVSTVDGFQGCETDIAILSCVRARQKGVFYKKSRDDLGFLRDFRRLNVAITRAKFSFWIVGQCSTLENNPLWKALLENARARCVISSCRDLHRLSENTVGIKRVKRAAHN